MFRFYGYVVENQAGDTIPQFFPTKEVAKQFCTQNQLPQEGIVQLYRHKALEYVEPKEEAEFIEP